MQVKYTSDEEETSKVWEEGVDRNCTVLNSEHEL